jgi:hypothetical protein
MKEKIADILIALSVVTVLLAAYVNIANLKNGFLNLAGTQWILIAIVLGIYGLYAKDRLK